jgi:hypothetical protein
MPILGTLFFATVVGPAVVAAAVVAAAVVETDAFVVACVVVAVLAHAAKLIRNETIKIRVTSLFIFTPIMNCCGRKTTKQRCCFIKDSFWQSLHDLHFIKNKYDFNYYVHPVCKID